MCNFCMFLSLKDRRALLHGHVEVWPGTTTAQVQPSWEQVVAHELVVHSQSPSSSSLAIPARGASSPNACSHGRRFHASCFPKCEQLEHFWYISLHKWIQQCLSINGCRISGPRIGSRLTVDNFLRKWRENLDSVFILSDKSLLSWKGSCATCHC